MRRAGLLYANVFVVATCGLVYELLGGTLASYLYGNAVVEFSLVLGVYLAALGAGAWVSRLFTRNLARRFLQIELAVAAVGGLSAPLLLYGYGRVGWFRVALDLDLAAVGVLVGVELPLLMRLLREEGAFKDVVARAIGLDYAGSLVASLAFPVVLVPALGLVRTAALSGLLNATLALAGTWLLRPWLEKTERVASLRAIGAVAVALFAFLLLDDRARALFAAD